MQVIGVKTPLIEPGDDLVEVILDSVGKEGALEDNDILVIASSVVSTVLGRIQKINEVKPSKRAKELAGESDLNEKFVEIIVQEADEILSPSEECILTLKDGMLRINAGVDRTNVFPGSALLIPENPGKIAEEIRNGLQGESGKRLGVIIADSHVQPLRLGTIGQALASSGLKEALDCRSQEDLYGRRLQITFRGIGDQLATAAQLVMGEANESTPVAVIRGANAAFSDKPGGTLKVSPEECVYSKFFKLRGKTEK